MIREFEVSRMVDGEPVVIRIRYTPSAVKLSRAELQRELDQ